MNILRRTLLLTASVAVLAVNASAQALQATTLKVGDPAPALLIKKWIKGVPVTTLGKGTVNVVEFWATWCGPCRDSIPHLTELAHKYKGKATFTGVSVFEEPKAKDESYMTRVNDFVKEMGAKMDYNVGADGLSGTMGKTWMDAAGQDGIPTAFVVDQKGFIAWIGHPMNGLDQVVGEVVANRFDVKVEAAKKAKADAQAAKLLEDTRPLQDALEAQKYDVAAVEAGKLMDKYPEHADDLAATKFQFLLRSDERAAYVYARELAAGRLKDKPTLLNDIAWSIVDDTATIKHRDYATAVVVAAKAAKANKMLDPFTMDTYAYALFKSGDAKDAADIQGNAVKLATKPGSKVPAKTLAEMKDRLAKMLAKANS